MKCLIPPLIAGIIFVGALLMLQPDWKSPPYCRCCLLRQVVPHHLRVID